MLVEQLFRESSQWCEITDDVFVWFNICARGEKLGQNNKPHKAVLRLDIVNDQTKQMHEIIRLNEEMARAISLC